MDRKGSRNIFTKMLVLSLKEQNFAFFRMLVGAQKNFKRKEPKRAAGQILLDT